MQTVFLSSKVGTEISNNAYKSSLSAAGFKVFKAKKHPYHLVFIGTEV